jgi:uncharacterized repeat protein (TIGR03837 family)
MKRWDIFCKIVDNFGDIGVCWRLARQLRVEHGLQIRLWIDDLEVAQKIIPSLNVAKNSQVCDEITICHWTQSADFSQAAEVVIEAFACELPAPYLAAMAQKKSKWVNLEYLSAENWVDDFHAKPSPQANGLIRYFYFPGFTEKTGGLIRETHIETQLQSHINSASGREALKVSLFCYPHAPIHDLLDALQANTPGHPLSSSLREFDSPCNHAVFVYVPATSILPKIAAYFGKKSVAAGDTLTQKNLTVQILPFLSQADYDQLLRDCDLNFVRGEDSWVRAIWAGKPFIWQPYFQDENAHIKKLKAFVDLYYKDYEQKEMLWKAHGYWLAEHANKEAFEFSIKSLLNSRENWQSFCQEHAQILARQTDLASQLIAFCQAL